MFSKGLLFFSHLFSVYLSLSILNTAKISTCYNCLSFRSMFLVLTSDGLLRGKVLALLNLNNFTSCSTSQVYTAISCLHNKPDHSRSFNQKNVSHKEQLSIFYGMLIGPYMHYVYCKTLSPAHIQPNLLMLEGEKKYSLKNWGHNYHNYLSTYKI